MLSEMSYRGKQVLYNITYKRTLKKIQMNVQYIQNKNKLTGIENKLTLPNGRGRRSVTNQDYAINRYKFITRKIDKQQDIPQSRLPRWLWGQRARLATQETSERRVWSLGQKDPLEKGTATHSSILIWRIPWTKEPGGLQPIRSQRIRWDWSDYYTHIRKLTQYSIIISNEV